MKWYCTSFEAILSFSFSLELFFGRMRIFRVSVFAALLSATTAPSSLELEL